MAPSNPMDLPVYRVLQKAYRTLGLPRSATTSEIRNAYKTLAVRIHPDKVTASEHEHATAEFQKLKSAYDICLPHSTSLAALNSKNATCEDDPETDLSGAQSGDASDDDAYLTHEDNIPGFNAPENVTARKYEKLYGGMVEEEEEEACPGKRNWGGRGANSQARWTAEQKLAQHLKAYEANGKLDWGLKGLTAEQRLKVKRAREKRTELEIAAREERAETWVRQGIDQAQRKAQPQETKKEEVQKLDAVPESWEDEMEDEEAVEEI